MPAGNYYGGHHQDQQTSDADTTLFYLYDTDTEEYHLSPD